MMPDIRNNPDEGSLLSYKALSGQFLSPDSKIITEKGLSLDIMKKLLFIIACISMMFYNHVLLPQYCTCRDTEFCGCNPKLCECVECRTV